MVYGLYRGLLNMSNKINQDGYSYSSFLILKVKIFH